MYEGLCLIYFNQRWPPCPYLLSDTPPHAGGEAGDEVIVCPTLRDQLEPRDSPFLKGNYHGGGFTSDSDRVLLQSVYFKDNTSAGHVSQDRLEELSRRLKSVSMDAENLDEATSDLYV